jgi:hypothetical protein
MHSSLSELQLFIEAINPATIYPCVLDRTVPYNGGEMIGLLSARLSHSTPTRIGKRKMTDSLERKHTSTTDDRDCDTESLASTVPLERQSPAGGLAVDFLDSQSPRYRNESSSFESFLGRPIERVLSLNGFEKEMGDESDTGDEGVFEGSALIEEGEPEEPSSVVIRAEEDFDHEKDVETASPAALESGKHVCKEAEMAGLMPLDVGILARQPRKAKEAGRRPRRENVEVWAGRWLESSVASNSFLPML